MRIEIKKPKGSIEMLHIHLTKKEIRNLSKGICYGEIITGTLSPISEEFVVTITRDHEKEEKK